MEISEIKKGQRLVVKMTLTDDSIGYFTGEVKAIDKADKSVLFLLDEIGSDGKPQKEDIGIDDVVGLATDEICKKQLKKKDAEKYLLVEEEAEDVSELTDSEPEKPSESPKKPGKSTTAPGKKGPPKEDEDGETGPDMSKVPKYNPKKAEVGDRLVVEYFSKAGVSGGLWKGTVDQEYSQSDGKKGWVGIAWDAKVTKDDFAGWIREDHILGRGTEVVCKSRIQMDKVLRHLVGKDGKPLEETPAFGNNGNKERFDSLDAQIAALTAMVEKLVKAQEKKK